ncbi:hypothetical protein [Pseudomonas putida]|uniref:Uncharacterized protein n=1 Tax=Pseudomonas putida TaxID=303 RepID=A0A8I1EIJ8_PSEPU|nr:hypothetical protein [Pseudomonas putida]MBI6885778.1 hypothetical protein [Pseudomonas putida]
MSNQELNIQGKRRRIIKNVAIFAAAAATVFTLLAALTWALFFKSWFEYVGYQQNVTIRAAKLYEQVRDSNDQAAMRDLEKLSHQNNAIAALFLSSLYKKEAITKSGINMKDPDADTSKVNGEKIDSLILQAMQEYNDEELWVFLSGTSSRWRLDADVVLKEKLSALEKYSTSIKNSVKLEYSTTLSQEQRSAAEACFNILSKVDRQSYLSILSARTTGSCTEFKGDSEAILKETIKYLL